jgi:hypothetical protein
VRPRTAPTVMLLAALALAAPAIASQRYTEQSDQAADARGIRALEADNPRGDVEVAPSPDGRIHVTAIKTCRGRDRAEAQRYARDVSVTAGPEGDRYVIRVHYPKRVDIQVNFWELLSGKGDSDDFGPRHDVRLLIQVPEGLALRLESVSGDLAARGLAGRQSLQTTSGDCSVDATGGALDVRTVSGDAKVRGRGRAVVRSTSGDIVAALEGPVDARSVSGDIDVPSAGDSLVLGSTSGDISVDIAPRTLTASTSSGSIEVLEASGTVAVSSTSGSLSVGLRAPLAGVAASSSSGDVELRILGALDASLAFSTSSGDIECDMPVVLQGHGRQHMNAQLGRGGAPIKAQTVSGDLHVTSGGKRNE